MSAFGFLNLNKPFGWTSHDCVAKARRLFGTKRVGHGGTLDPAATGVLPLAVGRATRLLQFLPTEKAYRACCRLGVRTTTDDLEGEAIACAPVRPNLQLADVRRALATFVGTIEQIPPTYSAIQRNGQRLYARARAGETDIEVPPRQVEVCAIDVLDWRPGPQPEVDLEIACGPGTYIRAIARDLGEVLGTGGTLAGLTRTASAGFSLASSMTLEELAASDCPASALIPPAVALGHLAQDIMTAEAARHWRQGRAVFTSNYAPGTAVCAIAPEGEFLGVGMASERADGTIAIAPRVVTAPL